MAAEDTPGRARRSALRWLDAAVAVALISAMAWLVGLPERLDGRFRLVHVVREPAPSLEAGLAARKDWEVLAWRREPPALIDWLPRRRHLDERECAGLGVMSDVRLAAAPNGRAFLAEATTGQVYRLDHVAQRVVRLPVGYLEQFAVDQHGWFYVVDRDQPDEVRRFAQDGRLLNRFTGQAGPIHVVNNALLILDQATGEVWTWNLNRPDARPERPRDMLGRPATEFCPSGSGSLLLCVGDRIEELRDGEATEIVRLPRDHVVRDMVAVSGTLNLLCQAGRRARLLSYSRWRAR